VRPFFIFLLVTHVPAAVCRNLAAQNFSFGKNKVSYTNFDWQVLQGEHFDIYFYPEGEEIARLALLEAERSYRFLSEKMNHEIIRKVPFIVYSSHGHFEETNIIPVQIPEGVLGFTEYMKGRVALPFGGSVIDFFRVIRHELVHVFQHDIISRQYRLYRRIKINQPPLWFTEGIAEYYSSLLTPRDEMFLRDMVVHSRLGGVDELWKYGSSFPVYKAGESFIRFIVDRYGEGALVELVKSLWQAKTFRKAVKNTFGSDLSDLSSEWMEGLESHYGEDERDVVGGRSVKLSHEDELATMPAGYRDENNRDRILYFSARLSTVKIREIDPEERDSRRTVITSGKEAIFESLHPFNNAMDVDSLGTLVFTSKYNDRDALILWNLEEGELYAKYQFDNLMEIRSPSVSPSGNRIVFTGLSIDGMEDIYVYNIEAGTLLSLTSDFYSDRTPDWSPDGRRIVFSSDRTAYGTKGAYNLFILDLVTGELRHLTCGPWIDLSPRWSPDTGEILFVSDRDGYRGIYVTDEWGNGSSVFEFTEGVFYADWSPGSESVLFSTLEDLSIVIRKADYTPPADHAFNLEIDTGLTSWIPELENKREAPVIPRPYQTDYSFDIATGGIGFSSAYGTSQAGRILISDTLGDKLMVFQISNTAAEINDLLKSMNITAAYLNLKHRINIGFGAFHWRGRFVDLRKTDFPFWEEQYGGFMLLEYPFSRYKRISTSLSMFRSKRREVADANDRDSFLATNTLSFSKDNTVWLPLGPIEGERYSVGIALTNDITRAEPENVAVGVDYRRYFRTGLASTYAVRMQARVSAGSLPERSFLGGSWSMRGYRRFSIVGTRAILINQEWRFLLLRGALRGVKSDSFWLPPVEGAFFFDAGNAWDSGEDFSEMLGSFGFGLRVSIAGPFILRFDFARRTDFHSVGNKIYTDFFIGYDY